MYVMLFNSTHQIDSLTNIDLTMISVVDSIYNKHIIEALCLRQLADELQGIGH